MDGYVYPVTQRICDTLTWKAIKASKSKWQPFSFEESSIDLGVGCEPRFVVDDVLYTPYKQYFIKEGTKTIRLMVIVEAAQSEQGEEPKPTPGGNEGANPPSTGGDNTETPGTTPGGDEGNETNETVEPPISEGDTPTTE